MYAYTTVAQKDSLPEDSFGNHQAASYMQNQTQIRGVKAKLDDNSLDEHFLATSPLDIDSSEVKGTLKHSK